MTELNIKVEIGKRILEARKAKGLTLKELGALTGNLKQTRLTNWERGTRTPGPEEIKQLALALDVSPAFLMCLSDERELKHVKKHSQLIPLLDSKQACNAAFYIEAMHDQEDAINVIAISTALLANLSKQAFALKMPDDSMTPEFRLGDVLIIEPLIPPQPGDYVTVKVEGQSEAMIAQYKKLSYTRPEFELLTLNDHWPNIKVDKNIEAVILGTVVQNIRTCLPLGFK